MRQFKKIIKNNFEHFTYFYTHLRHKIFIALGLSLVVGVLDGLGLAMFLPLLEMVDGKKEASAEGLGNLGFLVEGMEAIGLGLNIGSVLLVILFFFILKGIARFLESYNRVITQQYFIKSIRFDNIDKLSNYSFKAFVTADSGRIQNTLSGEVERVNRAYQSYFLSIQAGIMVIVYVVLAFLTNAQFALLVAIGGVLSNFVFKQIYKKTKEVSRSITQYGHQFQGLLIQKVAFFKYFKATGFADAYANKLKETVLSIEKNNRKIGYYNSILAATREPLVIMVVVGVIMIQVSFFSEGLGPIILSLLFFYRSLTYLMALQTHWNTFLNVSGSLENMTEFMRELSKHQDKYSKHNVTALKSGISVEKVFFGYDNSLILKNVSLSICKNETVAFVGESGSGKTTLVNLIAGLMPVNRGEIKVDGSSFTTINIKSYQSKIGYITQEPVIFNDTVFNNITLWSENTPENRSRFWEALEKASIADFVKSLPGKEEESLGSNGILVSGGQKQRLSIARELYKDVDILIMDEATSALDSETERIIQENIDALKGSYTILIVAHRLTTVRKADKIILLEKGEIAGSGDFDTLTKESQAFSRMVNLQEL